MWRLRSAWPVRRGERDETLAAEDLARAARWLVVRTRREASGPFVGAYASAFRGGGMEFHESRPYVPGDDVRWLDWHAMARTGEPFVKRFREERDRTLWLALDVSASMGFAARGRPAHRTATHAVALLAAAAGRAGDRVGFVAFDDSVRAEVLPGRGGGHTWRVIREAARGGARPAGATRLAAGIEAVRARSNARATCILLSDFRDPTWLDEDGRPGEAGIALAGLARRHELVSMVLVDPGEQGLVRAGPIRVEDPERPGRTWLVGSGRAAVRSRHRRASAARRRALERTLGGLGSDVVFVRTDRDPLHTLLHWFRRRAAAGRSAP